LNTGSPISGLLKRGSGCAALKALQETWMALRITEESKLSSNTGNHKSRLKNHKSQISEHLSFATYSLSSHLLDRLHRRPYYNSPSFYRCTEQDPPGPGGIQHTPRPSSALHSIFPYLHLLPFRSAERVSFIPAEFPY